MKTLLSILVIISLSACSTTGNNAVADRASNFANSPTGRVIANTLITAAVSAGEQYAGGRKIDPHRIVADTLDGAAESLRSLSSTPRVDSPGAIAGAVTTGAGVRAFDNTVSPIVAGEVMRQIGDGTKPNQAIENLATTMNSAAARTRQLASGP